MFVVSVVILDARQKRAEELRRLTDQSASMSEEQLTELRADIKHFVSERKYDEDLGKAVRFTFDLEPLKTSISAFGSGTHENRIICSRRKNLQLLQIPEMNCFLFVINDTCEERERETSSPQSPDIKHRPSETSGHSLETSGATVYHPRTGYSNRSRCSSTSSSVTSPSLMETPPPTQTQSPPSESRPPPTKQVQIANQLHTHFPGKPSYVPGSGFSLRRSAYNGSSYHDRNTGGGRSNHRYQGDGGGGSGGHTSQHSTTTTTREAPPTPPSPPTTTKTDPPTTGCRRGLRGRTALDAGNPHH
ncbi:hypothetical protein INR49_003554 [Caranx melampygus]|nr:hypothetical protein INR49_003554 [Caranx melampygus]